MKIYINSLIVACVSLSFNCLSQTLPGSGNGLPSFEEGAKSEYEGGVVAGSVNTFTGDFQTSIQLGTVNSVSGLSFEANLSYSSSKTIGDNPPITSGVPYGDGWNLNLPTISIDADVYRKYTQLEEDLIEILEPDQKTKNWLDNCDSLTEEGFLHWHAPTINIPGVYSGRLVFKYTSKGHPIFVPHLMDTYIEVRLFNGMWQVHLNDGTVYEFLPTVIQHFQASNQRFEDDCIIPVDIPEHTDPPNPENKRV